MDQVDLKAIVNCSNPDLYTNHSVNITNSINYEKKLDARNCFGIESLHTFVSIILSCKKKKNWI